MKYASNYFSAKTHFALQSDVGAKTSLIGCSAMTIFSVETAQQSYVGANCHSRVPSRHVRAPFRHSRAGGNPVPRLTPLDARFRGHDEKLDARLREHDEDLDARAPSRHSRAGGNPVPHPTPLDASLRGHDENLDARMRGHDEIWMPAFAGMTKSGVFHVTRSLTVFER